MAHRLPWVTADGRKRDWEQAWRPRRRLDPLGWLLVVTLAILAAEVAVLLLLS